MKADLCNAYFQPWQVLLKALAKDFQIFIPGFLYVSRSGYVEDDMNYKPILLTSFQVDTQKPQNSVFNVKT